MSMYFMYVIIKSTITVLYEYKVSVKTTALKHNCRACAAHVAVNSTSVEAGRTRTDVIGRQRAARVLVNVRVSVLTCHNSHTRQSIVRH